MVAARVLPIDEAYLDVDELAAEQARRHLRRFVRDAWDLVEPGRELVPGFYIDAICDHLQAVVTGDIKRLVITLPPAFLKSTLVSVLFPAWLWIDQPSLRFLTTSHDSDLAMRDAVRSRRVITSDWYQARWGDRFALTTDQNVKTRYENDQTGHRISLGTGSGITGKRGDLIICDDPHDARDAYSETALKATVRWWNEDVPTRLNDPKSGAKIIIQQRIHVNDLAGVAIEQGYDHLNLPMEYDPEHVSLPTAIGWTDPRTEPGDVLDPVRYGPAEIAEKRRELGTRTYEAQYQQQPTSDEGGTLKRNWWRFYRELPSDLTDHTQSWDMNFKETDSGSYAVGQVWAARQADRYLLDQFRARVDLPDALRAIRGLSAKWPQATTKLVENKANGPAVVSMLRSELGGLIEVEPEGGKEARANAIAPLVEAGNVYLPDPSIAPWIHDFIEECAAFPNGAHDDQVDAMSQALVRMRQSGTIEPVPAQTAAALRDWYDQP